MRLWRTLGMVAALAILAAGFFYYRTTRPYRGFTGTVYVDLPRGTSTGGMAVRLAQAGAVSSRWDFWMARLVNRGRVLEAGEYAFDHPASAMEVIGRIARGDVFYYSLVIPEGDKMFDIGQAAEQLGVFKAADFVKPPGIPRSFAISMPWRPRSKAIFSPTLTGSITTLPPRSYAV